MQMRGSCFTRNLSSAGAAGGTAATATSRCCHHCCRRYRYSCLRAAAVDRDILPLPLSPLPLPLSSRQPLPLSPSPPPQRYPLPRYRRRRHFKSLRNIRLLCPCQARVTGLSEPVIGAEFLRCRYFYDYLNCCYFQLCCFHIVIIGVMLRCVFESKCLFSVILICVTIHYFF